MRIKNLFTVPEGKKITEKQLRRVLISSVCSMLLCMACLAGSTWAWFTVSIENTGNVIQIANPKVSMTICDSNQNVIEEDLPGGATYEVTVKLTDTGSKDTFGHEKNVYTMITIKYEEVPKEGSKEGSEEDSEGADSQNAVTALANEDDSTTATTDPQTETQYYWVALTRKDNSVSFKIKVQEGTKASVEISNPSWSLSDDSRTKISTGETLTSTLGADTTSTGNESTGTAAPTLTESVGTSESPDASGTTGNGSTDDSGTTENESTDDSGTTENESTDDSGTTENGSTETLDSAETLDQMKTQEESTQTGS